DRSAQRRASLGAEVVLQRPALLDLDQAQEVIANGLASAGQCPAQVVVAWGKPLEGVGSVRIGRGLAPTVVAREVEGAQRYRFVRQGLTVAAEEPAGQPPSR